MDKMTYVKALNIALDNLTTIDVDIEVIEKLTALRDAQMKKASADRKPTKKEKETADLREKLVDILRELGKPVTITELMETDPTFGEMSNQRVAALVRGMLVEKGGCVVRTEDKRKAYFSLAD